MTRHGITVCDWPRCYYVVKPGTPRCFTHQEGIRTEAARETEAQRLAEVMEFRQWHRDEKKHRRLIEEVLHEGIEWNVKFGARIHGGGPS